MVLAGDASVCLLYVAMRLPVLDAKELLRLGEGHVEVNGVWHLGCAPPMRRDCRSCLAMDRERRDSV